MKKTWLRFSTEKDMGIEAEGEESKEFIENRGEVSLFLTRTIMTLVMNRR